MQRKINYKHQQTDVHFPISIGKLRHLLVFDRSLPFLVISFNHFLAAVTMGESPDPPFELKYKKLFDMAAASAKEELLGVEECELPLIDLSWLNRSGEREACKRAIAEASREWGFFQVINHGVSNHVLKTMREEQVRLLRKPFPEKKDQLGYQWGTPYPTSLDQFSWSESLHLQLQDVLIGSNNFNTALRSAMEGFVGPVSQLAQMLAEILAQEIGHNSNFFTETCAAASCFLRLNRYPPCRTWKPILGITKHTDSSFLTVLQQDTIGGLQLVKNEDWVAVKPYPDALVINIGDLFQAWSNDVYTSVHHRVVLNGEQDRFSTAYFFCPSYDTVIDGGGNVYRSFTFGEYKRKVREDVKHYGSKIGLSRFLE